MLLGLRTIVYKVADLATAKAWYTNVLGIDPYFDEPYYTGFNVGGYELGLDPDLSGGITTGNNSRTYWGVEDFQAIINNLKEKKITVVHDIQNVGGNILVATIADPFGNCIGLIENPEFKLSA